MNSRSHHPCPICAQPVPHWDRYPRAVCEVCCASACDANGRALSFSNSSLSGGFKAIFTENQAAYHSHICYIAGIQCWADEARFGGIVIEVMREIMSEVMSKVMDEPIKFYHLHKPYGNFSNFAAYAIELNGKIWPTSEHYFQAQKFVGTPHEEAVRQAATAREAAEIGRDRSRPLRPDWEAVKDDIMRTALYAKFTQHPDLTKELLETGDAILIEHTKNDRYWGDGGDGTGVNRLGELLMEIRNRIRHS